MSIQSAPQTIIIRHESKPGFWAGLWGCLFGLLGIFTIGVFFVPLAALCAVVGLVRGLQGSSSSGIGMSLLAGVLAAFGFVISPSMWLLVGAIALSSATDTLRRQRQRRRPSMRKTIRR